MNFIDRFFGSLLEDIVRDRIPKIPVSKYRRTVQITRKVVNANVSLASIGARERFVYSQRASRFLKTAPTEVISTTTYDALNQTIGRIGPDRFRRRQRHPE